MAYNESLQKRIALRHLFFPNAIAFVAETLLGLAILFVINITNLTNRISQDIPSDADQFQTIKSQTDSLIHQIAAIDSLQKILLFLFWGLFGMLIYVGLFKLYRLAFGTVGFVREEQALLHGNTLQAMQRLQDIMSRILIDAVGIILITFGVTVAFLYANSQISIGLSEPSEHVIAFTMSFAAALIGMRILFIGACFLSSRFREWYVA